MEEIEKPVLVASPDGKVRCHDVFTNEDYEFPDLQAAYDALELVDGRWNMVQGVEAPKVTLRPQRITKAELRKYNHDFVTVRLPVVKECGHTFDPNRQPSNNCEWCWFAYFNTYGEMTKAVDECFRKDGKETLIRVRGEKFTKMFLRYMATVADFVKTQKERGVVITQCESKPIVSAESTSQ